ncbi:DciA family protein [Streptomyces halstedii]|uniref:DciA family protein n=1 Tax=Streptomyces halstedii TaxID=1944 RepID=UPI001EF3A143|nr:DciA family protein [Streptomyces halstedii]
MTGELSGVNLARQALVAAREAARKNGATAKKPKRRTTTVVRRDGREPLGLGAAISMMMTERGLATPAAGGSVLAQFDAILAAAVPELAGRVQAAGFDADTGRLDVVPDAPAVGTKLRWSAPKLIDAANEEVPNANVHALHVLAPAPKKAGPATAAAELAPQPTAPVASVEPRTPSGNGTRREAPTGTARHSPPIVPPGTERRRPILRSRPPTNGRCALRPANPRNSSATAARPSPNPAPKRPPSNRYAPATRPGHGPCTASPPNGPGWPPSHQRSPSRAVRTVRRSQTCHHRTHT